MIYRIAYTPKARKQIDKLDRQVVKRIRLFMERLDPENPRRVGKPLVNSEFWRYRVGDYRILARIDDDILIVLVVGVGHRRSVYRTG